ncbi:MAG: prolyl oligopeptidase family serine peptidase [Candidatus Cloacimonetes bacterium]|nr:prolyl oligopeptidase family serine peptidase [Candidatus Cloacimonadota bacterium]
MIKKLILSITLCSMLFGLLAKPIPMAPTLPDTLRHLGTELIDHWAWMKDRENPKLYKQLKAEDKYASQMLQPSRKLSKEIMKEFVSHIPTNVSSYPYEQDGYLYYSKDVKNKSYAVHYRKKNSPGASAELLMDENKLAKGKDFFSLGIFSISPDSKTLAYSADYLGNEIYQLYLKDISSGKTRSIDFRGISDFVWQSDNINALITMQNKRLQVDTCYRLDTSNLQTDLIYKESDPAYDVGLYFTCDKRYIILSSSSKDTCENSYLARNDISSLPKLILPRKPGHQYYPDILDKQLYLHTNLWNPDFAFAVTTLDKPETANWQQLIPPEEGVSLSSVIIFKDYLVAVRRINGFERIQIFKLKDATLLDEIIPPSPSDLSFWHNPDPNADCFTYSVENELTPYSIFRYTFGKQKTELLYQSPVPGSYHAENYQSRLLYVQASDGTKIPLHIVYRKGLDVSKPQALWLSGYGAYGDTNDPYFSTLLLSLLDRDVIFAVAHIRGGGEYGQNWYDAGRLNHKQNSFTDYVSCLDYIIASGLSEPAKIVVEGGSAGGLLMGAVTNLAPTKMRLVIADVPFVDLLSTMLDDSLPLTLQEYEEWGNPNDLTTFNYMKQYSPYDNVKPALYPNMLISAAWFDTRVGYWEALKWTQKLRANNLGTNPIIFRMLYHEGHTGSNDRFKSLKTYADTYAYALSLIR